MHILLSNIMRSGSMLKRQASPVNALGADSRSCCNFAPLKAF